MSKPSPSQNKLQETLTPKQIVEELNKYIIGQSEAKRSVAIALRNRMRRQMLENDMKDEVAPKNIIMIGSTGVGKTEIARRLAAYIEARPEVCLSNIAYTLARRTALSSRAAIVYSSRQILLEQLTAIANGLPIDAMLSPRTLNQEYVATQRRSPS